MSAERPIVIIVEASYYSEVTEMLANSVIAELDAAGYGYDRMEVPGVFELPTAVKLAMECDRGYVGAVALGCVIRGETDHYDHICRESSRVLMDLTMAGITLGFGILTCENYEQAMVRADVTRKNKGKEVAAAVLRMIALKSELGANTL
jgi:6,7-dimethyl-8-ribityllumazine synthase